MISPEHFIKCTLSNWQQLKVRIPMKLQKTFERNNTSGVEKSEDKNYPNLSSDCRPRGTAFTKTLKCLKDTLNDDNLDQKRISARGEYVVDSKLNCLTVTVEVYSSIFNNSTTPEGNLRGISSFLR